MDPRVDAIVTVCLGTKDRPHIQITFPDRRTAPRACPICGRTKMQVAEEATR